MVDPLMDISQAADYLQVHKQTMYRLIERGKVPAVKFGTGNKRAGTIRFDKDTLDAWIKKESQPKGA